MKGGMLWVVWANHGFETIDAPFSQGSIRIVYALFAELKWDVGGCASGEKMRRKLASAFKCLTVSDITGVKGNSSNRPRRKRRRRRRRRRKKHSQAMLS